MRRKRCQSVLLLNMFESLPSAFIHNSQFILSLLFLNFREILSSRSLCECVCACENTQNGKIIFGSICGCADECVAFSRVFPFFSFLNFFFDFLFYPSFRLRKHKRQRACERCEYVIGYSTAMERQLE